MPSTLRHLSSHNLKVLALLLFAITLLVGLSVFTTVGQVKPNLPIKNNNHQHLVITVKNQHNQNYSDKKIEQIFIGDSHYRPNQNWLLTKPNTNLDDLDEFLYAEEVLHRAIDEPTYIITEDGNQFQLTFTPLKWQDYSPIFFSTRVISAIVLFFSIWIYYIAPKQRGATIALFGSFSLAIAFLIADKWLSRLWAMDADTLYASIKVAEIFGIFYSASLFYLIWYLPKPLSSHGTLRLMPLMVLMALFIQYFLNIFHVVDDTLKNMDVSYTIVHLAVYLILVYKFYCHYQSRRCDILGWVAIRWVALAALLSIIIPFGFHVMVVIGSIETVPAYVYDSIAFLKIGLSALVASSVLYQADSFWWRLWVLLVGVTVFLISYFMMHLLNYYIDQQFYIALSLSVIAAYLMSRHLKKRYVVNLSLAIEELLPKMLTINPKIEIDDISTQFINTKNHLPSAWVNALVHIFRPVSVEYKSNAAVVTQQMIESIVVSQNLQPNISKVATKKRKEEIHDVNKDAESYHDTSTHVTHHDALMNYTSKSRGVKFANYDLIGSIESGGAVLTVIDVTNNTYVTLTGANKGLKLFTQSDLRVVQHFWQIIQQHHKTQQSFLDGVANERKRVAADLHDDIGGKLLYLASREGELGAYAHETLQDLRILARGLSSDSKPLEEVLADINYKLAEKCELTDVALEYDNLLEDNGKQSLHPRDATTLTSIYNELTRNALSHNKVTYIKYRIRQDEDNLIILFSNDGDSVDPSQWHKGLGIPSITRRINNWDGSITWEARRAGGVDCRVSIPIRALFSETTFAT